MAICTTKYFGEVPFSAEALIEFPRGPAGFEDQLQFLVLSFKNQYPLVYLQSLSTPDLCFVALPVLAVDPAYRLALEPDDAMRLGLSRHPVIGPEALCLAVITPHEETPTANLLAPIVVNLQSRRAGQCLHADGWYSHQHPLALQEQAVAV